MKVYEKCDNLILDSCSIGEYAFLSKLRRFISFNENVIRCGGNHEGHVLTPKEIAEELHMNVNQVRDYIRFFKNADILADYNEQNATYHTYRDIERLCRRIDTDILELIDILKDKDTPKIKDGLH